LSNRTNARTRTAETPTHRAIRTGASTADARSGRSRMAHRTAPARGNLDMRKYILAVATFVALAFPTVASASFTAAGPTSPLGFPAYYEDATGLQVGLCIEDPGCPASPPAADMIGPDGEAFYQLANAAVTGPNGAEVIVDFNIEGAFLDADPITFGRIQFTAHGLAPNATYTVDHPYGQSHFNVGPNGDLVGGARTRQREETDGTFAGTLGSSIGPFLRSTSAPAGYLGNGVTPTTVTGGVFSNTVTVSGPGLPEAVVDELGTIVKPAGITTDKFVVEGKLFDPNAPLPPAPVPVPKDTDGDGVPDIVDLCINQIGDALHNGCPAPIVIEQPPVIVHEPAPPAKVIEHTNTIVRTVQVPAPVQPASSTTAAATAATPKRVRGMHIHNGLLTGRSPRNADQVRMTIRRNNGRVVRVLTVHVSDVGQAFKVRLARKHGRYTVEAKAGNEQGSALVFGTAVIRTFRVR
jgi:hypothetical protein